MTDTQSIIDNVDEHLSHVQDMTKKQSQSVDQLIEKNKQNIEAFGAFVDAKEISDKVSQTMKDINSELDSAMKDIEQRLQSLQKSSSQ